MSLSVTPAGSSLTSDDMDSFMGEAVSAALTLWTGRSDWTLNCEEVKLLSIEHAFDRGDVPSVCLISAEDDLSLIHISASEALERLASADALGLEPSDITDDLDGFQKIHNRVLTAGVVDCLKTPKISNMSSKWISSEETKVFCAQSPDIWLYDSIWTAKNVKDGKDYQIVIKVDRRILPEAQKEKPNENSPADIESLKKKLGPCRLPVRIVGGKMTLSIADCMKLEIGQVFDLPEIDFNAVSMKMPASDDVLVEATLGTFCGAKAVRMKSEVNDDFLARYASQNEMP